MKKLRSASAIVSLSAIFVGCGEPPDGETLIGSSDTEEIQGALVSGASLVSLGDATSESEAVIAVTTDTNGQAHTIVTANADHPNFIIYSDGGTANTIADDTRTTWPGSSQMVIWHRLGLTGSYTSTRILPPDGGALWGDPAIYANGQYVYATSLHVPIGRFPSNGVSRGPIVNKGGDSIEGSLAGACIARSSNWGQTWSMTPADCPYDNGHFYDGGAVISNSQGKVFAAFNDVDATQIDVWRTDGPTSPIYQTQDPFPGKRMDSHPRMKFVSVPYLMALDDQGNLWMTRYVNHAWETPVFVVSGVHNQPDVTLLNNVILRQGPGFDFSVYLSPFDGSAQVVFVVTTFINGVSVLKAGGCDGSGPTWKCAYTPGAQSNSTVNCFSPAIATGFFSPAPGVGAASTKITYQRERSTGGRVALYASPADFSTTAVAITGWQTPCPDLRGYWGDYDSMVTAADGFHRVFSDSTGSACARQGYTELPLGVSEAVIPIH